MRICQSNGIWSGGIITCECKIEKMLCIARIQESKLCNCSLAPYRPVMI